MHLKTASNYVREYQNYKEKQTNPQLYGKFKNTSVKKSTSVNIRIRRPKKITDR